MTLRDWLWLHLSTYSPYYPTIDSMDGEFGNGSLSINELGLEIGISVNEAGVKLTVSGPRFEDPYSPSVP
jgi:hypothetical protein